MSRRQKVRVLAVRALAVLVVLLMLAGLAAYWLTATESGTGVLLGWAQRWAPGELRIANRSGALRDLRLQGLEYDDPKGLNLRCAELHLVWHPWALLRSQLKIDSLEARQVAVLLPPPTDDDSGELPSWSLPLAVELGSTSIEGLTITPTEGDPIEIAKIDLAASGQGELLRLSRLRVVTADAELEAMGELEGQAVDLELGWQVQLEDGPQWRGGGRVTGDPSELVIEQQLDPARGLRLAARIAEPFEGGRLGGALYLEQFDPQSLDPSWPAADFSGELRLAGTLAAPRFEMGLRGGLPEPESERWSLAGGLVSEDGGWRLRDVELRQVEGQGVLRADGSLLPSEATRVDLSLDWQQLSVVLADGRRLESDSGSGSMSGSLDDYQLELVADLRLEQIELAGWHLVGQGNSQRLQVEKLRGGVGGGELSGEGEVVWQPQLSWRASLAAKSLDTAVLHPELAGSVSLAATTRGKVDATTGQPNGVVEVSRLSGSLRQQALAGSGQLVLTGGDLKVEPLEVSWGTARLGLEGQLAESLAVEFKIEAPDLAPLWPDLSGALNARGQVSGQWPRLEVAVEGQGADLRWGEYSVTKLQLSANLEPRLEGSAVGELQAVGLSLGDRQIETADLSLDGTYAEHRLNGTVKLAEGDFELALEGGFATLGGEESAATTEAEDASTASRPFDELWRGRLEQLNAELGQYGSWSLDSPVDLLLGPDRQMLDPACWRSEEAKVCGGGSSSAEGWRVDLDLDQIDLGLLSTWLPEGLKVAGKIGGKVEAASVGLASEGPGAEDLSSDGQQGGGGSDSWRATARLEPTAGWISYQREGVRPARVEYLGGVIEGRIDEGQLQTTAELLLPEGDHLQGWLNTALGQDDAELSGAIDARWSALDLLPVLVPELGRAEGRVVAKAELAGTLSAPRLSGVLQVENGQFDLPALGIEPHNIELKLETLTNDRWQITGQGNSGEGQIVIAGEAAADFSNFRARFTGERFLVSDTSELKAEVSPQLDLELTGDAFRFSGSVKVPQAHLDLARQESVVTTSSDVVVLGGEDAVTEAGLALSGRLRVEFGDKVTLTGSGVDLRATGSLEVRESPDTATTAVGELTVKEGTYTIYGQKLQLEQSRLIFTGGPISRPGLDLRAVREARDGTVAVLNARGTATAPEVTVTAEPSTSPSDALSYLLLGRPLSSASAADDQMMDRAATSLGLSVGGLAAGKLARRLGFDDAEIESQGEVEDSAFFIGKYLSPRLYLAYGVGILRPINIFRARYLIDRHWTLQAESGEETGFDVLYRVDR